MALAIREAEAAAAAGEVPVGAVVVAGDEVIGRGRNRIVELNDPAAHAELLALREATLYRQYYRLDDCVLYATLEPCVMCAGAIILARCAKVVFGTFDVKAGAVGSVYNILQDNKLNHVPKVVFGVEEEQCSRLLKDFFSNLRNRKRGS